MSTRAKPKPIKVGPWQISRGNVTWEHPDPTSLRRDRIQNVRVEYRGNYSFYYDSKWTFSHDLKAQEARQLAAALVAFADYCEGKESQADA